MTQLELIALSKVALRKGAQGCLLSATEHQRASEALFVSGLHGMAMSHLVLASEEAVKGLVLWIQYSGAQLPEDSHRVFDAHWYKHSVGDAVTYGVINTLTKVTQALTVEHLDQAGATKEQREMKAEVNRILKKLKPSVVRGWWTEANRLRNSGFYFDRRGRKWYRLVKVSREKFLDRFAIAGALIAFLSLQLEMTKSRRVTRKTTN